MNKFDELMDELHDADMRQTAIDWSENIPEDIWNKYFEGNYEEVEDGLFVEKYRWYETSTVVIKIFDRYLGIDLVTDLFSEQMCVTDCYVDMSFGEMKQVNTVTYEY